MIQNVYHYDMLWIDKKYLNVISSKLERFAWKSDKLANMRCPLCGDSHKNKFKARGYAFVVKGGFMYKCHNCSASMSISSFIKLIDHNAYQQYKLEKFGSSNNSVSAIESKFSTDTPIFREKIDLPSIESLPEEHYARQYIANRKIPKEFWTSLYYAADFRGYIDQIIPDHGKSLKSDSRIVIPFYDKKKRLVVIQGRALEADNKIRYITIKIDEDAPKIYGLDRLDETKKIYIVEGPIDSMFLTNAIAIADSNLNQVRKHVNSDMAIFISDNEPRNRDIVRQIDRNIDLGFHVFIWPNSITCKDINDLVLSGISPKDVMRLIDENTFTGIKAKFMLNVWKKI